MYAATFSFHDHMTSFQTSYDDATVYVTVSQYINLALHLFIFMYCYHFTIYHSFLMHFHAIPIQ
jgi:hypothetical protein